MKKLTKILSILLVFVLSLGITACSAYSKVEKAITDLGYTLIEDQSAANKYQDDDVVATHVFEKTLNAGVILIPSYIIVLEFEDTEDLIEYCEESETLKGIIKDAFKNDDIKKFHANLEKAGIACDNCIILNLALDPDVTDAIIALNK